MPLHPEAQAFLREREALGIKQANRVSVAEAREQSERLARLRGPGEAVARVTDRMIPGPHGEIPVRVYEPGGPGPLPIVAFYHGGGWLGGSLETGDSLCRILANAAPCVLVSVNYRHAPEHRHPEPLEDAWAGAGWVKANAAALGADPARLVLVGASSGGNLAAATALMSRDRGNPAIASQVLIFPVCDYAFDTRSYRDYAEGYGLDAATMAYFWDQYLVRPEAGAEAYASPLKASDLSGLPPAFVATAECDVLRDEGEAYADRLAAAGIPTVRKRYAGMVHGYLGAQANLDIARAIREARAPG